ncbi:hypothetical protein AB0L88_33260 [Saccharopolyspora shandongensis]|uniref:Uncharacterized protein n=1 Tax=Saccharopolyspora shandongensis TaxID=418495 RepID=A0A1H3IWF7_9PSEU|nr:hypothetical protein [Saccharopolyspora shandongensis]SDY32031.1 hypothetical protein SAMN05216215_102444 [Saccharopolyspora shandongensis]
MRKINRVLAAGALTLPLALGIAGVASAEGQDTNIRVESQASAQVQGRGSAEANSQASAQVQGRGSVEANSHASAQAHGRGSAEANSHASVRVADRDGRLNHRNVSWEQRDVRWEYRWVNGHWVRGHYHKHQDKLCFLDHGLIGHDLHIVR